MAFGPDAPAVNIQSGDPVDLAFANADGSAADTRKPTWGDRYLGFQEGQLHGLTGGIAALAGGATYAGGMLGQLFGSRESDDQLLKDQAAAQAALTYQPRTAEGKRNAQGIDTAGSYLGAREGAAAGDWVLDKTGSPVLAAAANTALNIPQFVVGKFAPKGLDAVRNSFTNRDAPVAQAAPPMSAAEVVAQSRASQSMGAAAADGGGTVERLTPETRAEIVRAGQAGQSLDHAAIDRHADAESLPLPEGESPLRLRKGQATRDDQQISDEKNMRADVETQGILTDSINDQNRKLGASMLEIQRRANPDIVQRTNADHGQANIDEIKTADNARVTDIRAKYKALTDANGGAVPIDGSAAIGNIDSQLAKGFLTKKAGETSQVSEVMDALRSGQPMSFEQFENARSSMAELQRGSDAGAAKAAGIVRDQLESMPLTQEAAPLKGLADTARKAAADRFKIIDRNPAYDAAIHDNVDKDANGLHVIGKESPLAPSFMDKFYLGNGPGAAPAYVKQMKSVVPTPAFSASIEAATLNKLRAAAGIDEFGNGNFRSDTYQKARSALEPKATGLLSAQAAADTAHLKRVTADVNYEGKGSSTNRSNTALSLQRFGAPPPSLTAAPSITGQLAGHGVGMALDLAHPGFGVVKTIGGTILKGRRSAQAAEAAAQQVQALKDAKLNFALDATKHGAGIAKESVTPGAGGAP
jgi:hypothetical protein